jgi:hypothetical protein
VLGDVPEVGLERRVDPLPVVRGGAQRGGDAIGEPLHALVEQRQVELLLTGEVLVKDRLADPGTFGDLVHRRRVIAARDEDLKGGIEQLAAAGEPGQAVTARAVG